jgi:hypothetical protein
MTDYTDERAAEIIANADEWADAFWHGRHSPHGDHGPIIAVIALARTLAEQRPQEEALLGYATNRQLVEELAARYRMGSTQAGYRTIDGDRFPIDPDSELCDPLPAPVLKHVYRPLHPVPNSAGFGTGPCQFPGCTAEPNSVTHGSLDLGIVRDSRAWPPEEGMDA